MTKELAVAIVATTLIAFAIGNPIERVRRQGSTQPSVDSRFGFGLDLTNLLNGNQQRGNQWGQNYYYVQQYPQQYPHQRPQQYPHQNFQQPTYIQVQVPNANEFQNQLAQGWNQWANIAQNVLTQLANGGQQWPNQPGQVPQPGPQPGPVPRPGPGPKPNPIQSPVPAPTTPLPPPPVTDNIDNLVDEIFTRPSEDGAGLIDIRVDANKTEKRIRREADATKEPESTTSVVSLNSRFGFGGYGNFGGQQQHYQPSGFFQQSAANTGSQSSQNPFGLLQQNYGSSIGANLATDGSSGQLSAANTDQQNYQNADGTFGNKNTGQSQSTNFDRYAGLLQASNANTDSQHVKDNNGERLQNNAGASSVNQNPFGHQGSNAQVNTQNFNHGNLFGSQSNGGSQSNNVGADGSINAANTLTSSGTWQGLNGLMGSSSSSQASSFNQAPSVRKRRETVATSAPIAEVDIDNRFGLGGIINAGAHLIGQGINAVGDAFNNLKKDQAPSPQPARPIANHNPVRPQQGGPLVARPPIHPQPAPFGGVVNHAPIQKQPVNTGFFFPTDSDTAHPNNFAPAVPQISKPQRPALQPQPQVPIQKPGPIGFNQQSGANTGAQTQQNQFGTSQNNYGSSIGANLATDGSSGQLSAANTDQQSYQNIDGTFGNKNTGQSQSTNYDKNTGQLQAANANTDTQHIKDKDGERITSNAGSTSVNQNQFGMQSSGAQTNTQTFNQGGVTGSQSTGSSQSTNIGVDGSLTGANSQTNSGTWQGPGGLTGSSSSSQSSGFNQSPHSGTGTNSFAGSGASAVGANTHSGSSTNSFGGNGVSGSQSSSFSSSGSLPGFFGGGSGSGAHASSGSSAGGGLPGFFGGSGAQATAGSSSQTNPFFFG